MTTPYQERVFAEPVIYPDNEVLWQSAAKGLLMLKRCQSCNEFHCTQGLSATFVEAPTRFGFKPVAKERSTLSPSPEGLALLRLRWPTSLWMKA